MTEPQQTACVIPLCQHRDGSPRLAYGQWVVCEQHRDMLAETLAGIGEWVKVGEQWVHLRDFLPPGGTPDDGEKVHGRRTDPPAPIRLDVLNLLDSRSRDDNGNPSSVVGVLAGWAQQVRLERRLAPEMVERLIRQPDAPDGPWHAYCDHDSCADMRIFYSEPAELTIDTERRLLARHLDWICAQYWVRDMWDQLRRLDRALREAVGDPYPRPIGVCPVPVDKGVCGTPLYAQPSGDGVRCRGCGEQWTGIDLVRLHLILEAESA